MDFIKETERLGLSLTEEMLGQFDTYYRRLTEVNEYMNLTAITEKEEVYTKHFLDSLFLVRSLDMTKPFTLCDVGSGAGFPGIPLAIVCKTADITIIDALNKRIKFLNELISMLKLENVRAYHKRAEEYGFEQREAFDVVTARAVARLNVLCELCMPLTKVNGVFIAMKGQTGAEELAEAGSAITTLGGRVQQVMELDLPDGAGKRSIIVIKKVKATAGKYPRSFARIKERPL